MARRLAVALIGVSLALSSLATTGDEPADCPARSSTHWQGIAPGVWVWPGATEEINPDNRGHVASQVLLASGRTATLIDPGPGLAHGREVIRSARCELGLEIVRVLNSHAHAENVLGNGAFAAAATRGTVSLEATAVTHSAMAQRCESCRAAMAQASHDDEAAATPIVLPEPRLQDGQRWSSEAGDWLTLEFRSAHSESDLAWWNESERLLIAPGLLYQDRLPELAQGSLQGWVSALLELDRLQPVGLVGNRPMPRGGLAATLNYLCDLERTVMRGLESGQSATEASRIELPAYRELAGHAERHGFNLQRAWRELEPRWIRGLPPACPAPD
jgi:glyoxylase-like metal-dependent hydrolase (beta-lactamase superfamily II)